MSLKNNEEDSSKKSRELVFVLALANHINAQSKLIASQLDDERTIHHTYNFFDGLSSSYSMFKYLFEVCISNSNDPDVMRRVLSSPQGMALFTGSAVLLVSYSFLASYFDKKKNKEQENRDALNYFITWSWPYFRDAMKGMKNAYKGWKSVVQIASILGVADLKNLIIPIGLVLGAVATINRFIQRYIEEQRKQKVAWNKDHLKEIEGLHSLTKDHHEDYLNNKTKIQYQTSSDRAWDYVARSLGGLIDSTYLYAGVASLAVLAPEAFLAMTIFSAVYSVACVASRIYEGYEAQRELLALQTQCKLALVSKELETIYGQFLNTPNDSQMKKEIADLITRFHTLRNLLKEQTAPTYATVFFLGIKNGLFAYGVLASFLFMATSVFSVTAAVFPPALLIAFISSGLVSIISVTASMMMAHRAYLQGQSKKNEADETLHQIAKLLQNSTELLNHSLPSLDVLNESLNSGRKLPRSERTYVQEWLEVFRSLFSGISKGNNFAGLIAMVFFQPDPQDHDHASSAMLMLTFASMAVFSFVLAFRALARGLGKDDTAVKNKASASGEQDSKTEASGGSRNTHETLSNSLNQSLSFSSIYTFFKPTKHPELSFTPREPEPYYKVVDLT